MRADVDASVSRHRTRKTRSLHVPHCRFFFLLSFFLFDPQLLAPFELWPSWARWGGGGEHEEEERAGMPVSRLVKLHIGCFWISWDSFFSAFNSLT